MTYLQLQIHLYELAGSCLSTFYLRFGFLCASCTVIKDIFSVRSVIIVVSPYWCCGSGLELYLGIKTVILKASESVCGSNIDFAKSLDTVSTVTVKTVNVVLLLVDTVTMATRAPKQWSLMKTETITSFESWRQNLLYT